VGDAFDLKRVERETFVAEIAYRPEVPSTNDWALELAREGGHRLPLLVLASQQLQGRGRGANRWWSASGALTFSLLLDTRQTLPFPQLLPRLSLAAGLSVCEALGPRVRNERVQLKWPNDVLLGRRKVCGILVESPARPQDRCVVGIGINVNNSLSEAPAEVRQRAVSLADAAGERWDLTSVLVDVLRQLEMSFANLAAGRLRLHDASRPWCALTGKFIAVAAGKKRLEGVCVGIDDDGALRVRTPEAERRLVSGVVESIRWEDGTG
jgi:BirA family transcriptional regulator, biotin operon repressor / biotin---[acetyl-CoA-carboxylase] ligase